MKTKSIVRNLALLASLVLILICCSAQIASADTHSGVSGDLNWKIDSGVLTITGSGDAAYKDRSYPIENFGARTLDWTDYASEVTSARVSVTNATDMSYWFAIMHNLTKIDFTGTDTSKVKDMEGLFYGCDRLTALDLSGFNTSSVEDMEYMFYGCKGLPELDLKNFATGNVVAWSHMFYHCDSLKTLDLSSFSIQGYYAKEVIFPAGKDSALQSITIPAHSDVQLPSVEDSGLLSGAQDPYAWIYNGKTYWFAIYADKPITYTRISTATPKTTITRLTTAKNHSIKVTWKKKSVSGYELQIAANKRFTKGLKTYTIKSAKVTSKTIKKLQKGRTYYVRVRTVNHLYGETYYGSRSAIRHIKCS